MVERSMRPIALNRKNALFAGHDTGAENWACLASLIETCKLNSVDPEAYLTDVLTRLVNLWPVSRFDELVPWAWGRHRQRAGRVTDAFTYAELDEILRGIGATGAIGMSAIDGLIAALSPPLASHTDEWIPLIFGGDQPLLHENTIFDRYNEVSETLAHPAPPGAGPDPGLLKASSISCPHMPVAEKRRRQTTAHAEIAQAVAAVRNICNPYRAVEARQPAKRHRAGRTRRSPADVTPPVKRHRLC